MSVFGVMSVTRPVTPVLTRLVIMQLSLMLATFKWYNKNMRRFFIWIIVGLIITPSLVLAEGEGGKEVPISVYLFHLYYENGQLFADRDAQFKYDIIPEKFIPETLITQFPYKGEVINLKGEVAETFQFDPRQGNSKFLKGKISVKAPYFADGQKVNFYDGQVSQLLSIFVSESSFCNDDGVCNSEVGEDSKTCPYDCKTVTPVPTVSTGPSVGGSGVLKFLIYIIIGIVIAGGGWYSGSAIWRRWKSRQALSLPPVPPNSENKTQLNQ